MLKLAGDFHLEMAVTVAHCCDSIITVSLLQFRYDGNRLKPNRHFSRCKLISGVAIVPGITLRRLVVPRDFFFICFASNDSAQSSEISSTAKIRSEVLSPFRSVRMFFYLAFVASGALGGFIATARLIAALSNSSRAAEVPEILQGLAIDIGAVSLFALLYYRENRAKKAQLLKLSREESLSNLKLRVDENKILRISNFRGIARLVILSGPSSFISKCFKLSEPFTDSLVERGVLVVPFATDGKVLNFEFEEIEEMKEKNARRKRLWQLSPVYVTDWTTWIDEQKSLANIPPESPVYLSLRMDGRVRGSGVGYPPWNALAVQLPLVKGMWSGLLDGMDGSV